MEWKSDSQGFQKIPNKNKSLPGQVVDKEFWVSDFRESPVNLLGLQ